MIDRVYRKWIIPGFESVWKRRSTFRFWHELEQSQWWSREQLESLQLQRLQKLIEYCFACSAYYRELWKSRHLHPSDLRCLSDIQKWPLTSRDVMRERAEQIRCRTAGRGLVHKSTGGSSGTPLQFVIDRRANERRMAAAYRGYCWAGAAPGTKQTYLWGITLGDTTQLGRWKDYLYSRWIYRRQMLNCFDLNEKTIPEYLDQMHRFRPDVLIAYTNPLYTMARAIERGGLRPYQPQSLIVGAEKLHDFQRVLIESVFGAPVFETYGAREVTLIGAECEQHAGMHLTMENLLVEIVDDDGSPTPAGEEGNIVITDLFNVAMPFVRYSIGDRAVAGFESCSCGRGLPLLRKVVGRRLDMLVTADGRHLAGEFFPHLLKDYSAVRQFQVVQSQRDLIELKLVVDHRWGKDSRDSLQRAIRSSVGDSTRLLIREVDQIPLTRMGKMRVVVGNASLVS